MRSKLVSHILREVAQLLELKGENPFRIRAYQRAARVIEGLGDNLQDIVKQDDLTSMPGIGKDLSAKIKEIITTGTLQYYEQLKEDVPTGLIQMLGISGLGPRTVKHIYDMLKIDDIDDLEEAIKSGKLRKLEGVKEKTEENILRGIRFLKKGIGEAPFYLASEIGGSFVKQIEKIKEVEEVVVAGSLRRGKDRIRDIDILAVSKESKAIIDKFVKLPLIEEILAKGEHKASVIVKDSSMQVDLRIIESKVYTSSIVVAPCYAYKASLIDKFPDDCVADDIYIAFKANTEGYITRYSESSTGVEIRTPKTFDDFFRHKFRKGNAYLIELFRYFYRLPHMPAWWKVIYLTKVLQLAIIPWILPYFVLSTISLVLSGPGLFQVALFAVIFLSGSLAIIWVVMRKGRAKYLGAGKAKRRNNLFLFIVGNLLLIIVGISYPFYRQTSRYEKIE